MTRRELLLLASVAGLIGCSDPPTAPPDAEVLPTVMPERLSETGMYTDIAAKKLSPRLTEFTPNNVLWSDGAEKHRYYQLPAGAMIDSTDMNHWRFPVGTKFFKEFARDGKRLETRLIWRIADTGNREADTLVGSFVWNDDESDAVFVKDGQQDLRGTDHDAPAADTCWRCHIGEPGNILGLSALQLGNVDGMPLSSPPPAGTRYGAPIPALGYLHANCGHCHNPSGGAWADSHMILRLDVNETDAATTQIMQTTVNAPLEQWINHGFTYRIVPNDPSQSALLYRMTQRTMYVQMPPLATEHTDDTGIAAIQSWIQSL